MNRARVVVAGGGISGLVAGFTLQQEAERRQLPLDVMVLEAEGEAGGHARTIEDDGWIVERGPNGFVNSADDTRALIRDLNLESHIVEANPHARRRFILRDRALRLVPSSPPALITSDAIGWKAKLRLLGEPWAKPAPAGKDESVFEFAERRLGAEAASTLVDTAVAGISAGDSRALSLRSQFPVLKEWETAHGSLLKAVLARRKTGGSPPRLVSFDCGMKTLTTALAGRLDGAVRIRTAINRVEKAGSAWHLYLNNDRIVAADRLVMALPAHAAKFVSSTFDRELSLALAAIPYAPITVVALGYRRSDIARALDGYGYLVTRGEDLATLGVLWESSIFPGRAPNDAVLLRVMLGGARRPDIRDLDDASVASLAANEAAKVLGISGQPLRQWTFRWPAAIAQYNVGHDQRTAAIRRLLAAHRGLHICGTAYDGVSFNDAIASARRTALGVIDELVGRAS